MWGKTLAFVIIFILVFGIVVAWIPEYFGSTADIQDQTALTALSAADLIVYSTAGSDNMTYSYSSLTDAPGAPQWNTSLPDGEYLEVWWGEEVGLPYLELRHVHTFLWGYQITDTMHFQYSDGLDATSTLVIPGSGKTRYYLSEDALVAGWDSESNSSKFTANCDHIAVSIMFQPASNYTSISESYEDGFLSYVLSYEWNPDDTGFNIMSLIVRLLTFQGVGVGVPGSLGNFIDVVISTLFYVAIAVVAYVVITAVIPFIPGPPDG
jgi:hypothetical protein